MMADTQRYVLFKSGIMNIIIVTKQNGHSCQTYLPGLFLVHPRRCNTAFADGNKKKIIV